MEVNYEAIFDDLNSLKDIETHYPYSGLKTWQIVMITILSTIVFIIVSTVILTVYIYKRKYQWLPQQAIPLPTIQEVSSPL